MYSKVASRVQAAAKGMYSKVASRVQAAAKGMYSKVASRVKLLRRVCIVRSRVVSSCCEGYV